MAIIPLASVDKLIRKAGAFRVSEGAAKELGAHLEKMTIEVAREAITYAEHAKRKTIKAEDIKLACKFGPGPPGPTFP